MQDVKKKHDVTIAIYRLVLHQRSILKKKKEK